MRDTGIGMSAEQIPQALEPFRQVSSPFARNIEGTGLGLALVKSLVECHDGSLSIESEVGQGHDGKNQPFRPRAPCGGGMRFRLFYGGVERPIKVRWGSAGGKA